MDRAKLSGLSIPSLLAMASLVIGTSSLSAAGLDGWKFDVLRLKTGYVFSGIIVDEDENSIRFQVVKQRPGEKTRITTTTKIDRDEIKSADKLSEKERDELRRKLESLDKTGKGELARVREITLKEVPWVDKTTKAQSFANEHFILISNANEDIVRRAAVRLEDIYAAYVRFLPPRVQGGRPTRIVLVRSMKEYRALIQGQGINFLNPAFFHVARNEVCCGTDLQEYGDELTRIRLKHKAQWSKLNEMETDLIKEFGAVRRVPVSLMRPIWDGRINIEKKNKENEAAFEERTQQFFQILYHEAFHAYLANFVFPPDKNDVPRWLNEGLAQIFETAVVEAGELRIGHVDKERYDAIKKALAAKQLLGIPALLKTGPNDFMVQNEAARKASERHYLNSYALAYYLTFEKRILGTPALEKYVQARKRGVDELIAFRDLIGNKQSLAQFEKDYQDYLSRLSADGTLRKKK